VTWRLKVPRFAGAVMVDVSVRTGDVVDARRFILLTGRGGALVGPARPLSAASCDGARAHVLSPWRS
jgi:hypothetical protein